jgi:hypothetical protein
MTQCRFVLAYAGQCPNEVTDTEFCERHAKIICVCCRQQATHECSYAGQFVCGFPLCDNCEGFEDPTKASGAWGFLNHFHRPKLTLVADSPVTG